MYIHHGRSPDDNHSFTIVESCQSYQLSRLDLKAISSPSMSGIHRVCSNVSMDQ